MPTHPPKPIFYVVAHKNYRIQLVSILGITVPNHITLNELTTVAAAYAGGQLFKQGKLSGSLLGIKIAAQMQNNIVNVNTGKLSSVITQLPHADQTNVRWIVKNLANALSTCTRGNQYRCEQLFTFTLASPQNMFAAVHTIADKPISAQQEAPFLPYIN